MGTAGRLVAGLVLVTFVSVVALRPLVANPAIAGALRDGFGLRELLLVGPLVAVTVFIAGLRIWSMVADQPEDTDDREATWNREPDSHASVDDPSTDAETPDDTAKRPDDGGPDPLSGQGGARDTEFEIEEKPPDARLHDHLDHLQAQLDSDETVREDLQTLAEVADEVEGDRTVPERCPQPHCDAVWTGRTVLGVTTGRYEVLDDGTRVQCLNCEAVHALEAGGDE